VTARSPRRRAPFLAASALLVLAACGGSSEGGSSQPPAATPSPSPTPAPAPTPSPTPSPAPTPSPGTFGAGDANLGSSVGKVSVTDGARGLSFSVGVYTPATPGAYPLIVYSHGGLADPDNAANLLRAWADQGYVVLAPTHADSQERQGNGGLRFGGSFLTGAENRLADLALVYARAQ